MTHGFYQSKAHYFSKENKSEYENFSSIDLLSRRLSSPSLGLLADYSMYRVEKIWSEDKRPYYRVWPGFLQMVEKLDLSSVKLKDIDLNLSHGLKALGLELPRSMKPDHRGRIMTHIIFSVTPFMELMKMSDEDIGRHILSVHSRDIKKSILDNKFLPRLTINQYYLNDDGTTNDSTHCFDRTGFQLTNLDPETATVEDYLAFLRDTGAGEARKGECCSYREDQHWIMSAYKLILAILMIAHDEKDSLLSQLVMSKDRDVYSRTLDPKYLEKAFAKGVRGWDLGKDIPTDEEMEEYRKSGLLRGKVTPHYRRGHLGIRMTGQGRSIPKIVYIKGAFINKDLIKTEIPEGYYDAEVHV